MSNRFTRLFGIKPDPMPAEPPKPDPGPEPTPAAAEAKKVRKVDHLAAWQFKPGQSGNPGGRPKGRSITAELHDLAEELDDEGRTIKRRIAMTLLLLAERDLKALKLVLDRMEGRVPLADKGDKRGTLAEAIAEAEAALRETEEPTQQCDDSASDEPSAQP